MNDRIRDLIARVTGRYTPEQARVDEAAAREHARPLSLAVTRLERREEEQ